MIEWYKDKNLAIYFDNIPQVGIRYTTPSMTEPEIQSVKRFPFICKKELEVKISDYKKDKTYNFIIPKGYCYDGASIPRIFWRVIGSNTDNSFLIPALIHDVLCEHHEYVGNDKSLSTNIFNVLLCANNVCCFKRFFMKNSVALFQTLFLKWT